MLIFPPGDRFSVVHILWMPLDTFTFKLSPFLTPPSEPALETRGDFLVRLRHSPSFRLVPCVWGCLRSVRTWSPCTLSELCQSPDAQVGAHRFPDWAPSGDLKGIKRFLTPSSSLQGPVLLYGLNLRFYFYSPPSLLFSYPCHTSFWVSPHTLASAWPFACFHISRSYPCLKLWISDSLSGGKESLFLGTPTGLCCFFVTVLRILSLVLRLLMCVLPVVVKFFEACVPVLFSYFLILRYVALNAYLLSK